MFAFSSLDFAIREQTRDGKHRQESLASACKKQAFGWLGVCHFVASACSDLPQVSVGSGRVWWVRFFVFARQEWIERMDDEEGEEDEESAQLRIWSSQTHSLSLTLFAWQDELFHTGEECIDRVAEARVVISWLHFFVICHFCWTFATMTKLVKVSNVRIWKHHFRRLKSRQRAWRPLAKASSDSLVTSLSRCDKNAWPLHKIACFPYRDEQNCSTPPPLLGILLCKLCAIYCRKTAPYQFFPQDSWQAKHAALAAVKQTVEYVEDIELWSFSFSWLPVFALDFTIQGTCGGKPFPCQRRSKRM